MTSSSHGLESIAGTHSNHWLATQHCLKGESPVIEGTAPLRFQVYLVRVVIGHNINFLLRQRDLIQFIVYNCRLDANNARGDDQTHRAHNGRISFAFFSRLHPDCETSDLSNAQEV